VNSARNSPSSRPPSSSIRRITGSTITDNTDAGIDATDAAIRGNATGNWWGQPTGPGPSQCIGNVTCTPALSTPPDAGPVPAPDVTGNGQSARDADGDGAYEDVTGDGEFTIRDVAVFLSEFDGCASDPVLFDFNDDGSVSITDVVVLLNEV